MTDPKESRDSREQGRQVTVTCHLSIDSIVYVYSRLAESLTVWFPTSLLDILSVLIRAGRNTDDNIDIDIDIGTDIDAEADHDNKVVTSPISPCYLNVASPTAAHNGDRHIVHTSPRTRRNHTHDSF